jgi:hypothetical protein
MKSRLALFVLVALVLLVSPGADCGRHHWELRLLTNTHTVFVGDELAVQVTAEPTPAVGYSLDIDWGDTTVVLNDEPRPDTFAISHRWDSAGVYSVRAWGHTSAGWWPASSEPETVTVLVGGPHAPIVDSVLVPLVVARGLVTNLTFYAHDPDGDSMRAVVAWSDTTDTMTGPSPNPAIITVSHVFTVVEVAKVVVSVRDRNGAVSLPDSILVPVGSPAGPPSHWPKWQHDLHNTGYVGGGK